MWNTNKFKFKWYLYSDNFTNWDIWDPVLASPYSNESHQKCMTPTKILVPRKKYIYEYLSIPHAFLYQIFAPPPCRRHVLISKHLIVLGWNVGKLSKTTTTKASASVVFWEFLRFRKFVLGLWNTFAKVANVADIFFANRDLNSPWRTMRASSLSPGNQHIYKYHFSIYEI